MLKNSIIQKNQKYSFVEQKEVYQMNIYISDSQPFFVAAQFLTISKFGGTQRKR